MRLVNPSLEFVASKGRSTAAPIKVTGRPLFTANTGRSATPINVNAGRSEMISPGVTKTPGEAYQEEMTSTAATATPPATIGTPPTETEEKKPNYLLYGGIGLAAILLLYFATRKK